MQNSENYKLTIKVLCINLKKWEQVHGFKNSSSRFADKDFEGCDSMTECLVFSFWLSPS